MNPRATNETPAGWELVAKGERNAYDRTERIRVPGGWLYRSQIWDHGCGFGLAVTFVSEPKKAGRK